MKCLLCGHDKAHKHGKTTKGIQRSQCPHCRQTFPENLDSLYYNRHLSPDEVHNAEVKQVKTEKIIGDEMWSFVFKNQKTALQKI